MIYHQWSKTKRLTSLQLLSVLRLPFEVDELQEHFDCVSMHTGRAALLTELRNSLVTECPTIQSASAEDLKFSSS